jgi:hypothetical protein
MLAHRAFCASAIFRREAADMIHVGRLDSWTPARVKRLDPRDYLVLLLNFYLSSGALLAKFVQSAL